MVIKNAQSNPVFHFIEVTGTETEILNCTKWCVEQFGLSSNSHHTWGSKMMPVAGFESNFDSLRHILSGNESTYTYRYHFPHASHRDWFILRWS